MNLEEIKTAVLDGRTVYWKNASYRVIADKHCRFLIQHSGGSCIALTWSDGKTLNGNERDFYVADDTL